jgi:hypothetical protein
MPIETGIEPFLTWLPASFLHWLVVVGALAIFGVLVGWLFAAVRKGPVVALGTTGRALAAGATDLVRISPRRVWALGWLAVRESIRRRVVVVFLAVFVAILLFAGWFLNPTSSNPARLYLEFVLTTTSYLVLVMALFLSTLSLPADIKNQTLHTVVTKPVRPSEVVLGRMLGCTAVGTLLLVIMGACFYPFVFRRLRHTHELTAADLRLQQAGDGQSPIRVGSTVRDDRHDHQHRVFVDASGQSRVEIEQGHGHKLTIEESGDKTTYRFGPPRGQLVARVPIRGKLRFTDREGKPTEKGINVGDEWTYRTYIEGDTLASAIWTFDGITKERFPRDRREFSKGLPLEMTIEVFRTYKGRTDDPAGIPGIYGSLAVRNPETRLKVDAGLFQAREFTTTGLAVDAGIFETKEEYSTTHVQYIPYELSTPEGTLDLFEDLVADGKLEVWLRCAEPGQYFGAAEPDVYFRARDASFFLNFAKGFLGIWLQMLLVVGLGVTFSTFLSGPIAMLATTGMALGGLVVEFIVLLARGLIPGGGPLEAFIRLVTHQNVTSPMETGMETTVTKIFDAVATFLLGLVGAVLPKFGRLNFADFVAYGYDIPANVALQAACLAAGFLLPVFVAGYFFLKLREIAK